MPFMIQVGIDGQPDCKCCRYYLHHCLRCWNEHHNGKKDNDYVKPEYYGMPMDGEQGLRIQKKVCKMLKKEWNPVIKPNKKRKYEEGDYHH